MSMKKPSIGDVIEANRQNFNYHIRTAQRGYNATEKDMYLRRLNNAQNCLYNFNGILQNIPDIFWINVTNVSLPPKAERVRLTNEFKKYRRQEFLQSTVPQITRAFEQAGIDEEGIIALSQGRAAKHPSGGYYDVSVSLREARKYGGNNSDENFIITPDHFDFLVRIFDTTQFENKKNPYKLSLIYKDKKAKMLVGPEGFRQRDPKANKARASEYIGFDLR